MMHCNISSPILKARKKQGQVRHAKRKFFVFLVILPCLLLLAILRFLGSGGRLQNSQLPTAVQTQTSPGHDLSEPAFWPANLLHAGTIYTHSPHNSVIHSSKPLDLVNLRIAEPIQTRSLTALLPVTAQSIPNLEVIISSLIRTSGQLHEVVLSCPEIVLSDVRRIIKKAILAEGIEDHLEFSLRPWDYGLDGNMAIMHAASEVTTDWVVFLDDNGLNNMDSEIRGMLLNPLSIPLPTGPRGVASLSNNISCLMSSDNPQPASFVIPPFVMSSSLVTDGSLPPTGLGIWADLGEWISQNRLDGIGGIVMGADVTSDWCHFVQLGATSWNHNVPVPNLQTEPDMAEVRNRVVSNHDISSAENERIGTFALLFPSLRDMRLFSSVACRLQSNGHLVNVLVYGDVGYTEDPSDEPMDWENRTIRSSGCRLNYDTLSQDDILPPVQPIFGMSFVSDWLNTLDEWPEVVVALKDQDSLSGLAAVLDQGQSARPSLILIPYTDLPYCEWMGSLSIREWKSQYSLILLFVGADYRFRLEYSSHRHQCHH